MFASLQQPFLLSLSLSLIPKGLLTQTFMQKIQLLHSKCNFNFQLLFYAMMCQINSSVSSNVFLIFDLLSKILEIDVLSSRLSRGTCYKQLHCDRKKCFVKTYFWPFKGNDVFRRLPFNQHSTMLTIDHIEYLHLRHFKK